MSTPSEFKRLQAKLDGDEGLSSRELGIYSAKLRDHYAEKCSEVQRLLAEVKQLRGDLNIARLERDAKLCSECPRLAENEAARATDSAGESRD